MNGRAWTPQEIALMREIYPTTLGGMKLVELIKRSGGAINQKARTLGLRQEEKRIYIPNDSSFDTWDENSAYWLGFIAADGCLKEHSRSVVIALSSTDATHLLKLQTWLATNAPLKTYIVKGGFQRTELHIKSERIYQRLLEIGLHPRKSLTLQLPAIPDEWMRHFMRGYSDGDGSFFRRSEQSVYMTEHWHKPHPEKFGWKIVGSFDFLYAVRDLLRSINIPLKNNIADCGKFGFLQTEGRNALLVAKYLYKDATVWLERKKPI